MQAIFSHSILFVADMERAVAFYRDVMGLPLRFQSPGWSEFDTGPVTLALHPASERNPAGHVELGFKTADLAGLYAAREANGLRFSRPPEDEHGTLLATIVGCEGEEISLSGA